MNKVIIFTGMLSLILSGCISSFARSTLTTVANYSSSTPNAIQTIQTVFLDTPTLIHNRLPPLETLSPYSKKESVLELLQTNASCKLPCWWGITPGKTTWDDAKKILLPLDVQMSDTSNLDGSIYHGIGGLDWDESGIYNRIGFVEKESIVDTIYVKAEGYESKSLFYSIWRHYALEELISTYGQPTRIEVLLFGSEQGQEFYYLTVTFNNQGILALYKGLAFNVEKNGESFYSVCPAWKDSSWLPDIKFYLHSPDSQIPLDQIANIDTKFRSIVEVSQVNITGFVALIQSDSRPSCFESSQSFWSQ